jgi:hypothetical protein
MCSTTTATSSKSRRPSRRDKSWQHHLDRIGELEGLLTFPWTHRPMFGGAMLYADGKPSLRAVDRGPRFGTQHRPVEFGASVHIIRRCVPNVGILWSSHPSPRIWVTRPTVKVTIRRVTFTRPVGTSGGEVGSHMTIVVTSDPSSQHRASDHREDASRHELALLLDGICGSRSRWRAPETEDAQSDPRKPACVPPRGGGHHAGANGRVIWR